MMSRHKKDPSPEFLSFANAQLEILPSVLDLLHAHRVPPLSLPGLAGSICSLSGLPSVRKSAPARGEGTATPGLEPTRPLWEGRNL